MSRRLASLSVLLISVGCASHHLATLRPATPELRFATASKATPADAASGAWTEASLPTQLSAPEAAAQATAEPAENWVYHATFFIGRRDYSDGNLEQQFAGSDLDLDESGFKGLEFDGCNVNSGHGYELGIALAYQTDSIGVAPGDYELTTEELYSGYRHTFRTSDPENRFHPYAGLGLDIIRAHFDSPNFSPFNDDGSALAAYGRAGFTFDVSERLRLGLDLRQLVGTGDFHFGTPAGTSSADADYLEMAFTVGYRL